MFIIMKHYYLSFFIATLMSMACNMASAHDIAVANSNGKTIYYKYNSDGSSVSVTYQGTTSSSYSNEYTGDVVIPETVTYNGKTYSVTRIDFGAFRGCSVLASITIPNSVTSIGSYAFRGCSVLASITIPNSVTSIGSYAFYNCSGLASITIPNSVTSIGSYAFEDCSGLTSVTIGSSVTSIGSQAFYGCSGLTSVTIPNSVTSIGGSAFQNCYRLKSVTIPNSVTNIGEDAFSGTAWYGNQPEGLVYVGDFAYKYKGTMPANTSITLKEGTVGIAPYAFDGCSGLTSVTIPNSVTSIGGSAFSGCSGLTSVTIPNSVTTIGFSAFAFCSSLASVTIPNSVTSIGGNAFSGCSGLTEIKVADGNNVYDSRNNCNAIIETSSNTLITGCKNTIIPNSVTSIGGNAFEGCSGLTSVTIPNNITKITGFAFAYCTELTSVNIPNSVTFIDFGAFAGCTGLKNIDLPNSVKHISRNAFSGSGLNSITIPSSVHSIDEWAFSDCDSLESITFMGPVEFLSFSSLWNSHFDYQPGFGDDPEGGNFTSDSNTSTCTFLTEINIPDTFPGVKAGMFDKTAWYNNQPDGVVYLGKIAYKYKGTMPENTTLTLKEGTIGIAGGAFEGCTGLTNIVIPNSVIDIGPGAFDGTTWYNNQPDGLVYVGNVAYKYKGTMPDNTSLTLRDGTVGIGDEAFYDCKGLIDINLPNSIVNMGRGAFYGCENLTSIEIPNSVKRIDYGALGGGFKNITIPKSVTYISDYAFSCTPENIIVQAETPPTMSYDFTFGDTNVTLYVPAKAIETYRTTSPWSNFTNIQAIPSTITKNGTCGENLTWVFDDSTGALTISGTGEMEDYDGNNEAPWTLIKDNIKEVIIENGVTGIAKRAFIDTELKYAIYKCKTPPTDSTGDFNPIADIIFVPEGSILEYKLRQEHYTGEVYPWVNADVEFYTNVTVDEYAKVMSGKDKATVTSVAMYDGMDENLTEAMMKDGMNPNCLYYIFSDKEITGDNIIDLKTCTANRIVLQSNNIFKCPVSFTATKAQFTYTPSVWANGFGGWETLCLPFEVSAFKASESGYISPILLGAYGDFWLRQFVGASSKTLYFSSTLDGTMKANTPYLLAFPGTVMGSGHLQGQTITFLGKNVEFASDATAEVQRNDKVFVGNYDNVADDASGWILNSTGSDLIASSVVGDKPFRAYFRTEDDFADFNAAKTLNISFVEDEETAIREINEDQDAENDLNIYSIDGTLIRKAENTSDSLKGLKKGTYIINRKKVMIR